MSKQRTQEEMFPLMKGLLESGLSAAAYSRQSKLKYATVIYWLNRYREQEQERVSEGFVSLAPANASSTLIVELPGGIRIMAEDEQGDQRLVRLLKELSLAYA